MKHLLILLLLASPAFAEEPVSQYGTTCAETPYGTTCAEPPSAIEKLPKGLQYAILTDDPNDPRTYQWAVVSNRESFERLVKKVNAQQEEIKALAKELNVVRSLYIPTSIGSETK